MKAKDIIGFMEEWAPIELAESWDNSGIQIGRKDKDIEKILISLDYDREVYELSKEKGIDMVITHHPFIFSKINKITSDDYLGSLIMDTIKEDLVIYASHTNLDKAKRGVNDRLAELFKLKNSEILSKTDVLDEDDYGYGQVGDIEGVLLKDYLEEIKSILEVDNLTVWGDEDKRIDRLALVGGSGASFIGEAKEKKADLLITGDIKYHDGQLGKQLGLTVIDAGHFHTEKIILSVIENRLLEFNPDLEIYVNRNSSPGYNIY